MNDPLPLPPKSVQIEARRRVEAVDPRPGAPGNLSGMPVLGAFQKFLEVERRKTRVRMMALTALFVVILIAVGIAGGLVVYWMAGDVDQEVMSVKTQIDTVQAVSAKVQADSEARASAAARKASAIERELERERELRAKERVELETQVAHHKEKISALQESLQSVEGRNAKLSREFAAVQTALPQLTEDLDSLLSMIPEKATRGPLASLAPQPAPAPAPRPATEPARPSPASAPAAAEMEKSVTPAPSAPAAPPAAPDIVSAGEAAPPAEPAKPAGDIAAAPAATSAESLVFGPQDHEPAPVARRPRLLPVQIRSTDRAAKPRTWLLPIPE